MSTKPFYQSRAASRIAFILMVGVIIYFGASISLHMVEFRPDLQKQVADLLTNLVVIVLVIERAIEIFITVWRNRERIPLEENLSRIEKKLELVGEKKNLDRLLMERSETRGQLQEYKNITRLWSIRASLLIGLVFSIAGFRILESLFVSDTLTGLQSKIYDYLDILLTAAVLAGGSKGIHVIANALGDFFEATSGRLKKGK